MSWPHSAGIHHEEAAATRHIAAAPHMTHGTIGLPHATQITWSRDKHLLVCWHICERDIVIADTSKTGQDLCEWCDDKVLGMSVRTMETGSPFCRWHWVGKPDKTPVLSPFYKHRLTLIPAWISNYINYNLWDEIIYPFPNFNSGTVEVWEWISNFIPHFIRHVITYPNWD